MREPSRSLSGRGRESGRRWENGRGWESGRRCERGRPRERGQEPQGLGASPLSLGLGMLMLAAAGWLILGSTTTGPVRGQEVAPPTFRIRLDPGHPWRPPFGLNRVGRSIVANVESAGRPAPASYTLV